MGRHGRPGLQGPEPWWSASVQSKQGCPLMVALCHGMDHGAILMHP
jgi:hypothetical protein